MFDDKSAMVKSFVSDFKNANMDQSTANAGKFCISFDNSTDFFQSVSNNTQITVNFMLNTTQCMRMPNPYHKVTFCNVGDSQPAACNGVGPTLTFMPSGSTSSSTSVWLWVGVGAAAVVVVALVVVLVSKGCKEDDGTTDKYSD